MFQPGLSHLGIFSFSFNCRPLKEHMEIDSSILCSDSSHRGFLLNIHHQRAYNIKVVAVDRLCSLCFFFAFEIHK